MFKSYLTLKIIDAVYIITLICCVVLGGMALFTGNEYGVITAIVIFVFSRMFFEVIIVQFKQAETLDKILQVLQGLDVNRKPDFDEADNPDIKKEFNKFNDFNDKRWRE